MVTEMEKRLSARDMSFDPAPDQDEDEPSVSPAMYLPSPDLDPAVAVENKEWDETTSAELASAIDGLDTRSQDILKSRWMVEEKATLHELAAKYKVSAERIRQIEENAIRKLRKSMASAA
jgi:RNA polymerase sigma-32 factor